MRQEAGRQHVATTAAVQVHNAAGDATGGQHTGQHSGGRADWQQPLQEQDPVSPASSSGSALDPQLFRSAFGSACRALQDSFLCFTLVFCLSGTLVHLSRLYLSCLYLSCLHLAATCIHALVW